MLDLLLRRRSIRKYEDRPIDRDILDKILLGALTSPSSNNRKPWELVVVVEKEKLSKLGGSRGLPPPHNQGTNGYCGGCKG